MKRFRIILLALVAAVAIACQPDDTSSNNGWIDTSVDGNADDTADDDSGDTSPAWRVCAEPTDCSIVANSCCGVCGQPQLDDIDAVNKDLTDEHYQDVCPEPQPCPECAQQPNPYLVATCKSQECAAHDVRAEPFTECETDADCQVRVRECCKCGGTTNASSLIAIANDGETAYRDLVCGGEVDCPACEPTYPDNATAVCSEAGHCEVEIEF